MVERLSRLLLSVLALALLALPVAAQPITVAPGNDGWVTPASSSQIDLGVFPITAVFGSPGTVSPQIVSLGGLPLDPPNLGSVDTLMERYPPSVTFATFPETHTFSVEIKALRLKGQTTVNGVLYNLVIALSEIPSGAGTITATRLTPDGGRFNSSFPVLPKLVFTEVANPSNRVVLDCGLVPGCPTPLTLGASNVCWEVAFGPNGFNPATKGITPIAAGIAVDGTYNGVNDYTTVGRKRAGFAGLEFHVGYNPTPPWGACGNVSHDHAVYSLTHVAKPPTDCLQTGTTSGLTSGSSTRTGATEIEGTDVDGPVISEPTTPTRVLCPGQVQTLPGTPQTQPSTATRQPRPNAKPRPNGQHQ